MKLTHLEYLRSVMLGVEDSLVSTTALIAGISAGSDKSQFVVMAGLVAVSIEAVSMGVGEYLSDDALDGLKRFEPHDNPKLSGLLMFLSYFIAGLIPLAPVIFLPYPLSLLLSVTFALLGLFALGYAKGKIFHTSSLKGGLKILILGGIATLLGLVVGTALKI